MTLRRFIKLAFEKDHAAELLTALDRPHKGYRKLLGTNTMHLRLDQIYELAEYSEMDPLELVDLILERRCRKCGCTEADCSGCIKKTGQPCHWIAEDLCSTCVQ